MKNSLKMGISIGGPTIIMVFVVLCLTTLGTLSLVTAKADFKLTQKTVESTAAYYAADSQGQLFLAEVDSALNHENAAELIARLPDTELIQNKDASLAISCSIKVNEAQTLLIELTTAGIDKFSAEAYRIKTWRVINTTNWDYEDYEIEFQDTLPIEE
jgi:hypothetical protein